MNIAKAKTALLRTSSATSIKRSGGVISITGLAPISYKEIISATQFKSRAEVVKVETIGGGSYTPLASTKYIVHIAEPQTRREGSTGVLRPYFFKTPADLTELGATAALQREAIHVAIVADINAESANNVVAATLGTGTGFTITDDAGYFPAKTAAGQSQRNGATVIKLAKDENGRGWTDATHRTVTTAPVYSFGVGSRMDDDIPVVYAVGGGNIVAGELNCPMTVDGLGPVSGQFYDAFVIQHLVNSVIPSIGEVVGHRISTQAIFVDDGAGSDTTNATGFAAFEREMLRVVFGVYESDPSAIVEFFDNGFTAGSVAVAGTGLPTVNGVPSGAAGDVNCLNTGKNVLHYAVIGTATAIVPIWTSAGLNLDQDATDNDGIEITPAIGGPQKFVVGTHEFSLYARVTITDVSDAEFLHFGFRKSEAYQTADGGYATYTDLAALGFDTEDATQTIKVLTNLNDAASITSTSSGLTWADTATKELEVRVLIDGSVKFFINKTEVTSVQASAFSFDSGDTVIPYIYHQLGTSSAPSVIISRLAAVPNAYWRIRS